MSQSIPRLPTIDPIEYAESDGRPMGETDVHRNWIIRLLDIFQLRYRDRRVYVAGDLLVYFEQGNPREFVVPDVFVVKDCDPGPRRTFKLWEEKRTPDLVIEVTSRSSRREDQQFKPRIYRRLGISEYILFDPTGDYLSPALQGLRLEGNSYAPIAVGPNGEVQCRSLAVTFQLDRDQLVVRDSASGAILLTHAEEEHVAREVERAARVAAEAELRQLRDELQRRDRVSGPP